MYNWKDKRRLHMGTSCHLFLSNLKKSKQLKKNTRNRGKLSKPEVVKDYNAAKKDVGMSDQMSTHHSALRNTNRNGTKKKVLSYSQGLV